MTVFVVSRYNELYHISSSEDQAKFWLFSHYAGIKFYDDFEIVEWEVDD